MAVDNERSLVDAALDPDRVRKRLRRRAETLAREEATDAMAKLTARGEITAQQRQLIGELARSLAARLVAEADSHLNSSPPPDTETVRAICELYDIDGRSAPGEGTDQSAVERH